jgi:hypothetical protein
MSRLALRFSQAAFIALVGPWLVGRIWAGMPGWIIVVAVVFAGVGGITGFALGIAALRGAPTTGSRSESLWAIWIGGVTAFFPVIAFVAVLIYLPAALRSPS